MPYHLVLALVAAMAGILFGYDTGVMSGAILFVDKEFALSAEMNGLVVGSVLLGALLGAIFSGRAADSFGRRKLLIATACAFAVGSIETALAPTIAWLVAGRVFIGIAIGVASYTAPLYIAEVSPAQRRGALVSLNQLAIASGILISYIVDYCCAADGNWRLMLGVGVVPAILLLAGMAVLPDSPRWLLARGDNAAARAILLNIYGSRHEVDAEVDAIQKTLHDDVDDWRMLFTAKVRPALLVGAGLAAIQQITGINTILYYAPTILRMGGFETNTSAILATMGIGVIFVLFTLVSLRLIDTLGRLPLLYAGLVGMAAGLASLAWVFADPGHGSFQGLALGSMLLYIASFAVSLGPIVWLMITEIFPLRIRGIGASVATCVNWASNLLVTATFLQLVNAVQPSGAFTLYLVLTLASIAFVYFFVPETKGISLEGIEEHLISGRRFKLLGARHDIFSAAHD